MNTTLQWLGQSFIKITTCNGIVIYIDPWKDFPPGNSLFPKEIILNDADIIAVTHGHLDHLGDTVSLAKLFSTKDQFTVISNFEIMIYLLEQGVPNDHLQAMNKGGTVTKQDVSFTLVDAVHSSGIGAFGPKHLIDGGEAGGFVIRLENGLTIYHAGDTDVFSDMELVSKRFHPDIALLPIGGIFTMDPETASLAVQMIRPKCVIPMHYAGTFQLPGSPETFAENVKQLLGDTVKVLIPKPGETIDLTAYANSNK